jgi:hypothetical protein
LTAYGPVLLALLRPLEQQLSEQGSGVALSTGKEVVLGGHEQAVWRSALRSSRPLPTLVVQLAEVLGRLVAGGQAAGRPLDCCVRELLAPVSTWRRECKELCDGGCGAREYSSTAIPPPRNPPLLLSSTGVPICPIISIIRTPSSTPEPASPRLSSSRDSKQDLDGERAVPGVH